jgi:uncharacterized protein DUF4145
MAGIRLGRHERGERGETIRKRDPDSAPDTDDPAGPCSRCGRVSSFQVLGTLPVSFDESVTVQQADGSKTPDAIDQVAVLMCRGCRQGTVVVEEEWIGDTPRREGYRTGGTIRWKGIHWWPPPGALDLDPAIPKPLREAYAEGLRCVSVRAPRAAAVMFRRTIEGVVHDRGSQDAQAARNLAAGLRVMANEHALDPTLADWAEEVRLGGNAGAHFDPMDDMTMEEAESLARLVAELFNYLYTLPATIQRRRAKQTP